MKVATKKKPQPKGYKALWLIVLMLVASIFVLIYACYVAFSLLKDFKPSSDENSETEKVAEEPTETGEREIQRADSANS